MYSAFRFCFCPYVFLRDVNFFHAHLEGRYSLLRGGRQAASVPFNGILAFPHQGDAGDPPLGAREKDGVINFFKKGIVVQMLQVHADRWLAGWLEVSLNFTIN
jgi:hypothetical protein